MKKIQFTPLLFLASLGAGGISVIPFAILQYTFHKSKGLIKLADIGHGNLTFLNEIYFRSLEAIMIIFSSFHFVLSAIFIVGLFKWLKTGEYNDTINDPLKNAGIIAPFISLAMTMNVFIGPIRYFIPEFAANLQLFMLPALIVWSVLWVALLRMEIKILKISFIKDFDVNKISFGWLLHPFALAMVTVTGTGIAAMAKSPNVAHTAAFMSLVTGSMGFFLLVVKLIAIFKSHFHADKLPERQFLPSFLIVLPIITLFAISAFRVGHYLEHQKGFHLDSYFFFVITVAFAFETWYLLFGLNLLKDYFKQDFFKKEFYITQWGLVCPFVAYAVLGAFTYKLFIATPVLLGLVFGSTLLAIGFFFRFLFKQYKCTGKWGGNKVYTC